MRGDLSRCKKPLAFGRTEAIVLGTKKGKKKVDEAVAGLGKPINTYGVG
jgi:hypothetical protein